MKKSSLAFCVFSVAVALLGGCKDDVSKTGGIGVVDVQKVSTRMGWAEELNTNMMRTQSHGREQIEAYVRPFREAYESKEAEIVKAHDLKPDQAAAMKKATQTTELEKLGLTKKEIEEFTQAALKYAMETNTAQQRLNQLLAAQQQALGVICSQAAEPAYRRVAAANHCSVIMAPTTLIYSSPAVDLTDKVIDDLQHSLQGKISLPDPPRLDLHPAPALPPATQPK